MRQVSFPFAGPGSAFARLKQAIIERTGHFYYEDKNDLLWERVERRLRPSGAVGLDAYLAILDDPLGGPAEWTALEAELTIGETYFFRYVAQFEALARNILPGLIQARAGERRLRIWSAGCATGAEPYSLAILLHEALGQALPDWRITILGTDLNETFLAAARRGNFGRWALRSLTAEQRRNWFDQAGERFQLKPMYRRLVRFERGNLLDLIGPTPPLELSEFDLILCRNVLIYFQHKTVEALARELVGRLRPDGWLLLGHAEPNLAFNAFAEPISLPGTVAYRPTGAPETPAEPPEPLPPIELPPPAHELALSLLPKPRAPVSSPPEPTPSVSKAPHVAETFETIRRLADLGDFEAARALCLTAIEGAPLEAQLRYHLGVVDHAAGRLLEAEISLRKACYLEPDYAMAHLQLGLVRLALGRPQSGLRALDAARKLAGTLPSGLRLRDGAGMTAGELRELARTRMDLEAGA